jgi:hypothetical protein
VLIALHKQARTTPAVRAEIAASTEPVAELSRHGRSGPSDTTSLTSGDARYGDAVKRTA